MKTSIKPILNRIGLKRPNYTLVLQIIRNRRRAVIFTPYRLQASEFNSDKGTAIPLSRRKADIERAREINTYLQEQIAEICAIVARMEFEDDAFTAHEIAVFYRQRCDRTLIHIFFNELIEDLEQRGCFIPFDREYFSAFCRRSEISFQRVDGNNIGRLRAISSAFGSATQLAYVLHAGITRSIQQSQKARACRPGTNSVRLGILP